ncbi:MAG: hypothetical protein A2166_06390 [Omnitrophica WOR_2 bacterium RBG_13_41_10]|nr:MAG: hypothetical protein A2166_06390 [Omnitrophica WOR_2 bacterium RBG_13_41_10]
MVLIWNLVLGVWCLSLCTQDIKQPNVAGAFYPEDPAELSQMIDSFLADANPEAIKGDIFALISPHAGYPYSGKAAALGYKLIKDKPYKTVIVIGPSHQYGFFGVSVYPEGLFRTPLGDIEIDKEFSQKLLSKDKEIFFAPQAFAQEHSVEVQLPFLQKVLSGFSATEHGGPANNYGWKIVPVVMGDCNFATCQKFASLLKEVIGERRDILIIASTDLCHSYNYQETQAMDQLTISYLKKMDAKGLYDSFRQNKTQACGIFPVITTLILSQSLGHNKLEILGYTNSASVTGKKIKGIWTVGYVSCAIDKEGEVAMLNKTQRKKLLEIARKAIETYLKTGKKLEIQETDPVLIKDLGTFVTLHERGELRGCIGNLIGNEPLYLAVRNMAIESAVGDPRFAPLTLNELANVEIEISVLSPMEKISSPDEIKLGTHGVLVRRGFNSGVYLPQVATETGWSKEEFLSSLCAHKAGLSPDAWKDKSTDIYIFTAEVFSEKDY